MRYLFYAISLLILLTNLALAVFVSPHVLWSLVVFGPLIFLGVLDVFNKHHTIKRNFPLIGRLRYFFELIRPEIQQYFIESDTGGVPFNRLERTLVYQRSKKVRDTVPYGTQRNVYATGFEWVNHSIRPQTLEAEDLRTTVGSDSCQKKYSASLLNISGMSFGALSDRAILAMNGGAKDGNFAHNTGEGAISPYHLEPGGDLIWQIGTGYFGCRSDSGSFEPSKFKEKASISQVKMIEIKLSQGAKPGHGGILPARKLTAEICTIRGVPMGKDIISPPGHSAFSTPIELCEFIQHLRELSGGKPVGFKLCVGKRREFLAICKAIQETGIAPDFITVDGAEGGTGAAPLEFSNHIGSPLIESLIFVHNALVGFNIRDRIRVIASGKVTSGFGMVKRLALGADICSAARAMMLAVGCIQALKCNSNECPAGVATQNRELINGLNVLDKRTRVTNFHHSTIHSVSEILGAMGLSSASELRPWHIMRRINESEIRHYGEIYEFLNEGDLIEKPFPKTYKRALEVASASSFGYSPE
tara:strand:- start:2165 stop:3757 length:1593 start_codon:yes stop_codon:yes gene_type:complete